MSRITYAEPDDLHGLLRMNAWAGNAKKTLAGKRGQAALAKLEAALLALPERRLIEGALCRIVPQGGYEVCALGALALYEGIDPLKLALDWEDNYGEDMIDEIHDDLNMTYTMAWEIMEKNDELFDRQSPEKRWESMLNWVREHRQ